MKPVFVQVLTRIRQAGPALLWLLPILMWTCATAGLPACHAQSTAPAQPAREQFVPVEQLDTIFARDRRGVLMSRGEFRELLQRAEQNAAAAAGQPLPIVAEQVTISVRPADQHAVIQMEVRVRQYADGWQVVRLHLGHLAVEKAEVDGLPAAAIGRDPKQPDVLLFAHETPGNVTLKLSLSAPLASLGSDRTTAFALPQVAATRLNVSCPAGQHLLVNDLKLDRPGPDADVAIYDVPVGAADQVRLRWTMNRQQSEAQTLVFVHSDASLLVQKEAIRWDSSSTISVFGSTINQVIARVPARLEITAVESTGLESWKLEDDSEFPGMTRVTLLYRQPFTSDRLIRIQGIATQAEGSAQPVPTLQFAEVTAHAGRLAISHEDGLRLLAETGGGIRVAADDSGTRSSAVAVFDFWMQPFELTVSVKPREQELFAELTSTLDIQDTSAVAHFAITVETLNAPLFELPLSLPAEWQLTEVSIDGTPAVWRTAGELNRIVVTPAAAIPAGQLLTVHVRMARTIADPDAEQTLPLPVVQPPAATIAGGSYTVRFAADLEVAPIRLTGLRPANGSESQLTFQNLGTELGGELSVRRRAVLLASRSVLRMWSDTRQETVVIETTVDVLHGTTRMLTLQLPEALGEDVHFVITGLGSVPGMAAQVVPEVVRIVEQSARPPADGLRSFVLKLDRRFSGSLTLRTTVQKPRTAGDPMNAPTVNVQNAVRQHGVLVFEAYPEQQLRADQDVSRIDGLFIADAGLADTPAAGSGRRVALTYRFVRPAWRFTVSEQRFDTEAVPTAIVELVKNVCSLSDDGRVQRSCRATFRTSGVQTLRFRLPDADSSFLWSTILNGEPVEVRRDQEDYLVAVPTVAENDARLLEVLFETGRGASGRFGAIEQQPLQFWIDVGETQRTPVDVLQQTWDVRYPGTSLLVDSDGYFRPVSGTDQPGWFRSAFQFRLLSGRELVQRMVPLTIFLMVLFVFTTLVIRRRWKVLVAVCLAGCLLMMLTLSAPLRMPQSARLATSDRNVAWDMKSVAAEATAAPAAEAPVSGADEMMELEAFGARRAGGMPGAPGPSAGGLGGMGMGMEGLAPPAPAAAGALAAQSAESMRQVMDFADAATPAAPALAGEGRFDPLSIAAGGVMAAEPLAVTQEPGSMAGLPALQQEARSARERVMPASKKRGSARLSVRVGLEIPDDYRSREFVSVGDTGGEADPLQLVVQRQDQIAAVRVVAALLVILLLWRMRDSQVTVRLAVVVVLLLAAAAAVPLLPNRWQSALDGVIIGALVGGVLWLACGTCRGCQLICRRFCSASSVVALLIAVTCGTACGQNADSGQQTSDELNPEVIVPYAADEPVLRADRVFVRHDQFLKLYNLAWPKALAGAEASPLGTAVVAAFYQAGQFTAVGTEAHVLRVSARYVVFSESDGPVEITLPLGPVGVREVLVDGEPAVLTPAPAGTPKIPAADPVSQAAQVQAPAANAASEAPRSVADRPAWQVRVSSRGPHIVDLQFDVNAVLDAAAVPQGSVGRVDLPFLPVASGTLELTLPEGELDVRVNGRGSAFRRDGRVLLVPVAQAQQTRIQWQPASKKNSADAVFHASVASALSVQDTGLMLRWSLDVTARQGEVSELDVAIPETWLVQSVTGEDVAGWSVQNTDATRLLRLQLRRAVNDQTRVHVQLYSDAAIDGARSSLTIPVPVVRGATRDLGTMVLLAGTQFQVRTEALSGVTQINPQEAPMPEGDELPGRRVLAWRYTRHPAVITVRATRNVESLKTTALHAVRVEEQRQLWTSRLTVQIAGVPRSRLELLIPQDFLPLDVAATGLTDWYVDQDIRGENTTAGMKRLCVQLQQAREGTVELAIQGQLNRGPDRLQLYLSPPLVMEATETASQLAVWLDSASENAGVQPGDWTTRPPAGVDPKYAAVVEGPPSAAFSSQAVQPGPVIMTLRPAIPTLIAESVTVTSSTDTSLEIMLALTWQITRAAADTFAAEVPTVLANGLTFDVPGQRRLIREDLGNGRTRLTFQLQQAVGSRLFVLGKGSLPLPGDGMIRPGVPAFVVPESGTAVLSGQSHFWVLVNQSSGLLQSTGDQKRDEVAATQITTAIPQELLEQSVTVQSLKADTAGFQLTFPALHQVAPAVVLLASHDTVLADDGSWRSRHRLQVQNESRQFLPVQVPEGSRWLYCLVQGQPTRVVLQTSGETRRHLIPIPQSGSIAPAFDVEFALAGAFDASAADIRQRWQSARLTIPVPVFPEFRDDPESGISVSRNRWSVYVPESWSASPVQDPRLTNVVPAASDDLDDVSLLSEVEQASLLLNSLQSAKDSVSRRNLTRALAKQQKGLSLTIGKGAAAEAERNIVLQRLNELGDLEQQVQQSVVAGRDLSAAADSASNLYLYEQDAYQNEFFGRNSGSFLLGNRAAVELQQKAGQTDGVQNFFRFALPEPAVDKKLDDSLRRDNVEKKENEPQDRKSMPRDPAPQSRGRQSQLLERRERLLEEVEDRGVSESLETAPSSGLLRADDAVALGFRVDQSGTAAPVENVIRGYVVTPQLGDGVQFGDSAQAGQAAAGRESSGLLSLRFEIPTDGVRLDFIRTGGNPSLAFDMRSERVVSRGAGWLWAFGCAMAGLLLISVCRKQQGLVFFSRVCLFVALASLAGWLLLASPMNELSVLICVLSSCVWCASLIALSFRRKVV